MTLHLSRQGATLRLRQGRLLLEEEGVEVGSFPARQVRRVAVWGNVRLSTPALVFLLRQGVPVFFLSLEGFLYGVAGAFPDPHPAHLRAQFGAEALPLARAFVVGKLRPRPPPAPRPSRGRGGGPGPRPGRGGPEAREPPGGGGGRKPGLLLGVRPPPRRPRLWRAHPQAP